MNLMQNYYQELQKNMEYVISNESEAITKAATLMSTCIETENKVIFLARDIPILSVRKSFPAQAAMRALSRSLKMN